MRAGRTYKFTFDLAAPRRRAPTTSSSASSRRASPGSAIPGQGGPPDNDLEVKILVVASDAGTHSTDAGTHTGDAGAHPGDAGTHAGDAGAPEDDAGTASNDDAGAVIQGGGEGDSGSNWNGSTPGDSGGGCSLGVSRGTMAPWAIGLSMLLLARSRRRRSG